MSLIEMRTEILSEEKTCFDLARSIDLHKESLKHTNGIPVSGKTTGLINFGEWVSWEMKHFGFVQHITSKITEFESSKYFVDEMVLGVFKSYRHEHYFISEGNKTIVLEKLHFEFPWGIFGKFVSWVFVKKYMTNLFMYRSALLKERAELLHLKREKQNQDKSLEQLK